jgi:hypothetical protein
MWWRLLRDSSRAKVEKGPLWRAFLRRIFQVEIAATMAVIAANTSRHPDKRKGPRHRRGPLSIRTGSGGRGDVLCIRLKPGHLAA